MSFLGVKVFMRKVFVGQKWIPERLVVLGTRILRCDGFFWRTGSAEVATIGVVLRGSCD
jgi:hypothetical protein